MTSQPAPKYVFAVIHQLLANRYARSFQHKPVTLLVGPSRVAFYVHANLIRSQPHLLETYGREVTSIHLPHEEPETIGRLISWLYTGS